MIEFEVYPEKPDDKAIVARYWAMDEDGKFVEQVAALSNFSRHRHHIALLPFEIDMMSKDHRLRRCTPARHLLLLPNSECNNTLRIDSDKP